MSYTDDKLKYYEQIPVQCNALESTQSLPIWSRFGHVLVLFFTNGIVWYFINVIPGEFQVRVSVHCRSFR